MPAGKGEGERGLTPATAGRGDGGGDEASFSSRGRTRELRAECLAILRFKPLNWGDVSAVEVNAARYLFPIPFFNSLDIQTAALVTANSNSQFHTPMPTSKRSIIVNTFVEMFTVFVFCRASFLFPLRILLTSAKFRAEGTG